VLLYTIIILLFNYSKVFCSVRRFFLEIMAANKSDTGEVEVSRVSFDEMPAEESEKAIDLIKEVMLRAKKGELRTFSEMARAIKASMDTKMGPTVWHVIVGEQVSSSAVTARLPTAWPSDARFRLPPWWDGPHDGACETCRGVVMLTGM
jgi:hypothetical protein